MYSARRVSRLVSIILAGMLCVGPAAFAQGANRTQGATVETTAVRPLVFGASAVRAQGVDRIGTSVAISQQGWASSDSVVIASGANWPDGLVAGPLAAALNAPVLLTQPGALPDEIADEVRRLGADTAIVIGGTRAVSDDVLTGLTAAGVASGSIERIGGVDRYATARLVAGRMEQILGEATVVALASGERFPDALSVSGFAGAMGMPVLLTRSGVLPAATSGAFEDLGALETLVVGGEAAISSQVETLAPHPTRVGGSDRYDTARKIADFSFSHGLTYNTIVVAVGTSFPDALCAGPFAASRGAMIVLTDGEVLSPATDEFFNNHCSAIQDILVVGGIEAIGETVVAAIESAAESEIAPEAMPLSEAAQSAIETISPDLVTFVFDAGLPELDSIEPSSVIIAGPSDDAPGGYLRRVVSVTEVGDNISVETTEASLSDVIEKGSLDIRGTTDPNAEDAPVDTDVVLSSARATDDTHVDVGFETLTRSMGIPTSELDTSTAEGSVSSAGVIEGSIPIPFDKGFTKDAVEIAPSMWGSQGPATRIKGTLTLKGSLAVNMTWGYLYSQKAWWGGMEDVNGLKSMLAAVYLDQALEIELTCQEQLEANLNIIHLIQKALKKDMSVRLGPEYQVIWVGPVPIVANFYLSPVVEVRANVAGRVGISVTQRSSISCGMRYDYGKGLTPIGGVGGSASASFTVAADASLEAPLGGVVSIAFYEVKQSVVDPTVGYLEVPSPITPCINLGATANPGIWADTSDNPWWQAGVKFKTRIVGSFGILDKTFGKLTWLNGIPIWQIIMAQAAGPFPSGDVVWWPSASVARPAAVATASFESPELDTVPSLLSRRVIMATGALNSPIDESTLEVDDFSVSGLTVTDAEILPDGMTVRLTTSVQTPGTDYAVSLSEDSFRTVDDYWAGGSTAPWVGFQPPTPIAATAYTPTSVDVALDGYYPLDDSTIAPDDFSVPGLAVLDAVLQPDGHTVRLTTTAQAPGFDYVVSVVNGALVDTNGWGNTSGSALFAGNYVPSPLSVVQKVSAGDGAAGDYFGYMISVSGDTALVGAYMDDGKGAAYVFRLSDGTWTQEAKLTASDGAASDFFGRSVCLSGDVAVIGARGDDDRGSLAGAAYVFRRTGAIWAQEAKLLASDGAASDNLSRSVFVSGDTVLLGADGDDDRGSGAGAAYVFKYSGGAWGQEAKLLSAGGAAGDGAGFAVALDGDTAVVGVYTDDTAAGANAGSACVFTRSGAVWSEQATLMASDGSAADNFGDAVALSGDTAVIGVAADDTAAGVDAGSAYIFVRSGGVWSQEAKISPSDPLAGDRFGDHVAVRGDVAGFSSALADTPGGVDAGAAYVFTRSAGVWTEQAKLLSPDPSPSQSFGHALGLWGDTAVVAAYLDDTNGTDAGAVYLYSAQAP